MHPLLEYSFSVQGYPFAAAREELKRVKELSGNRLEERNQHKRWDIFHYHLKHNPVYQKHVGQDCLKEWSEIPVLTKKDLQQPLVDRLSQGIDRRQLHIHNTSGSSGTPFYFAKDKFCHAMSWAIIEDRFGWHGIEMGKSLQARFYGIPLGGLKYYKEKAKDRLAARIRFPVFDLSDEKMAQMLGAFKRHKFNYINGYTSSLVLFARYVRDQGISLRQICPSLKVAFTTSEVCDDIDRQIMEEGFGVKVVNEYGAAELDLIAVQDEDGDWLVNYETLFVEVLDDNGHLVKPGEEGRVVITSLYNKAMPFIRYELGDMAVLSERKKGVFRLLERVAGRVNDFAVLPSGKQAAGLTFYYISKSLLEQGGIIKEFIIKQTALDHFVFEYVAERPLSANEKNKVQKAMDKYLEPGLNASFEHKGAIERTKAGKLKHFHFLIH